MTPDWQAIDAFISATIWELLWIGVSILIVYGIAVCKGDELLARAAERRRLQEWSRVSLIVAFRIQLAVMRGAWVPAYQAALPVARQRWPAEEGSSNGPRRSARC